MKPKKSRRLIFFVVLFAIAGIAVVLALRYYDAGEETTEELSGVPVIVGSASRGSAEEILRYPGTLVSRETVTLVPKISGRIKQVFAREGDSVRAGELLVRIEAESAELQAGQALSAWNAAAAQYRKAERGVRDAELENAQASLRQAEEDLAAAERNLERSKRLYEAGTIAKAAFEESESGLSAARTQVDNARRSVQMMAEGAEPEELDMARANAEAAEANYQLAELQLSYASVTSPVSGIVAKVFVDQGNMVGFTTALVAIIQADPIEVRVLIPEKHYGKFSAEKEVVAVRVQPIAYPDSDPFSGEVTSVAPVIDPASRTFEVRAAIPNPDGVLKPGMYVNTEIITSVEENLLMVPDSAVILRDDRSVIFVVLGGEKDRAAQVLVEVGTTGNRMVAISGAVNEADLIVFEGNAFLEDGQIVEVVDRR